ncbi:hypothetical protein VQY18_00230 [Mycoplasma feriruminatoris]|uniref:Chromosome partition protein Smc n=1 Tax=Mycoplasma feriruminatoris TaxID=1179777 RepID=A0A654IMN1_9MOLU|nr:hypothetical protein MF5583_00045 [Mycoplasma feriruminatoris]
MKKLFNILGLNFLLISTIITGVYLTNNNQDNNIVLKMESSENKELQKAKEEIEKLKKELIELKEELNQEFTDHNKTLEENKELLAKLKDYLKLKNELLDYKDLYDKEYSKTNDLLEYKQKTEAKLKEYEALFKSIGADVTYFKHNDPSKIINLINESKSKDNVHKLEKSQQIAISIGAGLTLLAIAICGLGIGLNKNVFKRSKNVNRIIISK